MRPARVPAPPLGRSVVLQAWSAVLSGTALLVAATRALHDYRTYPGDDPLIGVLVVVAAALAAPGAVGVALGSCALALRHRRPELARRLASAAFVVTVLLAAGCVLAALG